MVDHHLPHRESKILPHFWTQMHGFFASTVAGIWQFAPSSFEKPVQR
jgi:hypothetical protein